MKNIFFCFLLLTVFAACKDDDISGTLNGEIPSCVKVLYEDGPGQDTNLIAVKRVLVGEEYHYWLNTGFNAFDGPEYIVNESCDTVCTFCFCPPDPCHNNYNGDWEVVWEK